MPFHARIRQFYFIRSDLKLANLLAHGFSSNSYTLKAKKACKDPSRSDAWSQYIGSIYEDENAKKNENKQKFTYAINNSHLPGGKLVSMKLSRGNQLSNLSIEWSSGSPRSPRLVPTFVSNRVSGMIHVRLSSAWCSNFPPPLRHTAAKHLHTAKYLSSLTSQMGHWHHRKDWRRS